MNETRTNNGTILIVDDISTNIQLMTTVLERENFDVISTTNSEEAIEITKNNDIDLILLDIVMPNINGFQLCKNIKSHEASSDIPIIFISVLPFPENIVKGFEFGGVDYIIKPYNKQEFVFRIKTHVKHKQEIARLKQEIAKLKTPSANK